MNTDFRVAEVELSYKNNVPYNEREKIQSADDAYRVLLNTHDDNTIDYTETFRVLYLNQCNQVLGIKTISTGGVTNSVVDVRTILQGALLTNAVAMILGHNHPSGNPTPSLQDIGFTRKLADSCKPISLNFIEHIIVGKNACFSFRRDGRFDDLYDESLMESRLRGACKVAEQQEKIAK